MYITWSALELAQPSPACPWRPERAVFTQAGHAGAGRADVPTGDGRWWSVLALWDEDPSEQVHDWPVDGVLGLAWHVVLSPASYRGDAAISGHAKMIDSADAGQEKRRDSRLLFPSFGVAEIIETEIF